MVRKVWLPLCATLIAAVALAFVAPDLQPRNQSQARPPKRHPHSAQRRLRPFTGCWTRTKESRVRRCVKSAGAGNHRTRRS